MAHRLQLLVWQAKTPNSSVEVDMTEASAEIDMAELMAFSARAAEVRAQVAELDKPATAEQLEEARANAQLYTRQEKHVYYTFILHIIHVYSILFIYIAYYTCI